jgi:hypothetical protein
MNPAYSPQHPDTDPRSLHERQVLHVLLTSELIAWAATQGYNLTWGETWRTPAQAAANAQSGAGISNSLHISRLAVDFNAFDKLGNWLTGAAAEPVFKAMADYWLTLDPLCCAGYYFHSADLPHFSITYRGVM